MTRRNAGRKATRNGQPSHSVHRGVTFDATKKQRARPWKARINTGGKQRYIGTFATELDAAAAYMNALNTYSL